MLVYQRVLYFFYCSFEFAKFGLTWVGPVPNEYWAAEAGVKKVLLVTSAYHMPRARAIAGVMLGVAWRRSTWDVTHHISDETGQGASLGLIPFPRGVILFQYLSILLDIATKSN